MLLKRHLAVVRPAVLAGGADISFVVKMIDTYCEVDAFLVGLVGFVGGDDFQVCCLTVFQDGREWNEMDSVCTMEHVGLVALSGASDFIGGCLDPLGPFRAVAEFCVFDGLSSVGVIVASEKSKIYVSYGPCMTHATSLIAFFHEK
jgi:hypothetical protein